MVSIVQQGSIETSGRSMSPAWSPWLTQAALYAALGTTEVSRTGRFCPQAPPSRLTIGIQASVIVPEAGKISRNLRVRNEPNGDQIDVLKPGSPFIITGSPQCGTDGLRWWPISTLDNRLRGWAVEGRAPDDYLMVPDPS